MRAPPAITSGRFAASSRASASSFRWRRFSTTCSSRSRRPQVGSTGPSRSTAAMRRRRGPMPRPSGSPPPRRWPPAPAIRWATTSCRSCSSRATAATCTPPGFRGRSGSGASGRSPPISRWRPRSCRRPNPPGARHGSTPGRWAGHRFREIPRSCRMPPSGPTSSRNSPPISSGARARAAGVARPIWAPSRRSPPMASRPRN